jgi:DNA-3-methyladenine glycosylase
MSDLKFLDARAADVAPLILGCYLERELDGQKLIGRIVEVEAYDQTDAASHSYRGRTPRTEVMFGPSGHLYVYFTYGMHYCCNIVTGHNSEGSAILIRALEPISGENFMAENRHNRKDLTNGPAKICQALLIDKSFNGHNLSLAPLKLIKRTPIKAEQVVQTTRIGISRSKDMPWRYYIKDNAFVSKPAAMVG